MQIAFSLALTHDCFICSGDLRSNTELSYKLEKAF